MLTGLHSVMFYVPNIEEALPFYTQKLGFTIEDQQAYVRTIQTIPGTWRNVCPGTEKEQARPDQGVDL